jgi:hypothetical protein
MLACTEETCESNVRACMSSCMDTHCMQGALAQSPVGAHTHKHTHTHTQIMRVYMHVWLIRTTTYWCACICTQLKLEHVYLIRPGTVEKNPLTSGDDEEP